MLGILLTVVFYNRKNFFCSKYLSCDGRERIGVCGGGDISVSLVMGERGGGDISISLVTGERGGDGDISVSLVMGEREVVVI